MKKKYLILMLLLMAVPLLAQGEQTELNSFTFILNGIIGVVVFYGGRIIKVIASGKFDFLYWWKDNRLSLLVSLGSVILISVLNNFQPSIIDSILNLVGITIDENSGSIGTIAFGTFLSGALNEILKQLFKKTVVETDGNGNKID